jgi:hypothetical protein
MPIVFDLECRSAQHRFEGWFKSSDDYARQQERGLVACPHCGSADVGKAVQAPRLARKGNQRAEVPARATPSLPAPAPAVPAAPLPPQAIEVLQKLAVMQAEALKSSRFVGDSFAEDARAMHYGEREVETIHGRASVEQAKELIEEGIALTPLPFPVTPPEQAN